MNALSKLFETLHLSRGESASRRSHRRRRTRRQVSSLSCETLEPKQLLAADVAVQFSDLVLDTTDPTTVAIEGKFEESKVSSGTIVKFETNAPLSDNDFYVELTDNTPQTNANFLSYVNSGAYDNSMFHRSVTNFVLQGGGFSAPLVDANRLGSEPLRIPNTGTVQNEPGNPNNRGTIAMAKSAGQPDSATSQFFFNIRDNDNFLDSDSGGYTQFGSVLGSGMTVVDSMNAVTAYNATDYYGNRSLTDMPLWNLNADNIITPNDFVKIENVDVVTASTDFDLFTYQVTSSDAAKLTASVDGNGNLVLTPDSSATGSVDVTVTATSRLDNSTASDTFSVSLNGGGGGPVDPVLVTIEEFGNTVLQRDQDGFVYANGTPIYNTYNGESHLTVEPFPGCTVVAVEDLDAGGKKLAIQTSSQIVVWSLTDDYKRDLSVPAERIYLTNADAIETQEVAFSLDFNGGGIGPQGPVFTTIENAGGLTLQRDQDGYVYANESPIYDTYRGETHLTVNPYSGNTVVAVENLGEDGIKLVIQKSSQIVIWTLDLDYKRDISKGVTRLSISDTLAIEEQENLFGIDIL
ncbi:MAG: peptidylprolyl isomerase [Pirellulales bacterium]